MNGYRIVTLQLRKNSTGSNLRLTLGVKELYYLAQSPNYLLAMGNKT